MIGFIGALAVVAIVAALVVADAAPRPTAPDMRTLAPWDRSVDESGNGHALRVPGGVSEWGDGAPPDGADPWVALKVAESAARTPATSASGSIDLLPAGAPLLVGAPRLRPDPERLIQTEVAVRQDPSVRWLAVARLVAAVVGFAAAVALGMIGFARGISYLIKKLAGG